MRWHLVTHAFRRTAKLYALAALPFVQMWLFDADEDFRRLTFILSIETVFFLGPMMAMQVFSGKEIFLRPVSRRELWQATWIAAVIVPAIAIGLMKSVGATLGASIFGDPLPTRWNTVALSILLDMAYAGFFLSFVGFSRYGPRVSALPRQLRSALDKIWNGGCLTIFLGGFVWIVLIRQHVPTSWAGIGMSHAVAVALAGAVAIAAYFLPMKAAPRPSVRTERIEQQPASKVPAVFRVNGAGGLRLIALTEAWMFLAFVVAQFVVLCALSLFDAPWQGLPGQITLVLTSLFDRKSGLDVGLGVWPMFAMLLAIRHPFLPLLRRLRTLPISTARLTGFLVGLPLAQATAMWAVLIATHVAMTGAMPVDIRLDLLSLIVGIATLSHALLVRTQAHVASFWILVFSMSLIRNFVKHIQSVNGDVVVAGAGVAMLAIAILVNYRSLTERSEIFRVPLKPAFSSPGEGA